MIYVHPQLVWRHSLQYLNAYADFLGLTLWAMRTKSGKSLLVLR